MNAMQSVPASEGMKRATPQAAAQQGLKREGKHPALQPLRDRRLRLSGPKPAKPQTAAGKGIRFLAWLLLAGWLLVAHGCHGDEDNELFAQLSAALASAAASRTATAPQ
jgi:hypothetical protein